jgi:hypothetical protein
MELTSHGRDHTRCGVREAGSSSAVLDVHLLHRALGARQCAAPCLELVQHGAEPPERYRVLQLTEIPDRLVWSMVVT